MTTCISCQAPVLPSFVHSLKINQCPSCGDAIFDESGKQLIDEIAAALEQMGPNATGIAGWLLANYKITKLGSEPAQPVEFYGEKKKNKHITENVYVESNSFLQRAGVDLNKLNKAQEQISKNSGRLRNIVKEIEQSQQEMYGYENNDSEVSEDEITSEDIDIVKNMMPFAVDKQLNPSNFSNDLKAKFAQDAEEASKIHPELEKRRLQRLAQQEANSAQLSGKGRIKRAGADD